MRWGVIAALLVSLAHSDAGKWGPGVTTMYQITAYTHTGNRTASGLWPVYGMAACPRQFAFGTRLHVEGIGVVTCRDRGSAIVGYRLDLFMDSRAEAIAWGRRRLQVKESE